MLPNKVAIVPNSAEQALYWLELEPTDKRTHLSQNVLNTELLHLCWWMEETLEHKDTENYLHELGEVCKASIFQFDVIHATFNIQHSTSSECGAGGAVRLRAAGYKETPRERVDLRAVRTHRDRVE